MGPSCGPTSSKIHRAVTKCCPSQRAGGGTRFAFRMGKPEGVDAAQGLRRTGRLPAISRTSGRRVRGKGWSRGEDSPWTTSPRGDVQQLGYPLSVLQWPSKTTSTRAFCTISLLPLSLPPSLFLPFPRENFFLLVFFFFFLFFVLLLIFFFPNGALYI